MKEALAAAGTGAADGMGALFGQLDELLVARSRFRRTAVKSSNTNQRHGGVSLSGVPVNSASIEKSIESPTPSVVPLYDL